MFRNLKKKTKKISIGKKVKNNLFFLGAPISFLTFTLYVSKSTNHFEKKLHIWVDLKEAPQSYKSKKIDYKSKKWNPYQNSKNTISLLGINLILEKYHISMIPMIIS